MKLSLQISQSIVQFHQIGIEPVKAGAPVSGRLFRGEFKNGKITVAGRAVGKAGKVLTKECDRMFADHSIAFVYGKHRSQHPLILGVWLAEVEVWHTRVSSAEKRESLIVRKSFCYSRSCLGANPSQAAPSLSPLLSPHFGDYFGPQPAQLKIESRNCRPE